MLQRSSAAASTAQQPATRVQDESIVESCDQILEHLANKGINFLAIDFDLTMIDVHTGGRWAGTAKDLSTHLRPLFAALVPKAIAKGMYVAIVTFSPQVSMIADVLKEVFPDVHHKIPIRGQDGSWEYHGEGSIGGKQAHMASAAEELGQVNALTITRASTLLIDDDHNNVMIAFANGVKAVFVDPNRIDSLVQEFFEV